jgi:diguanylate cyclase (GGDEF)-like protein
MLIHVKELSDVQAIAKRIIDSLQKPIDLPGNQVSVGASIGIAAFPDDGKSLEELIKKADKAMYAVKRSGKGSYQLFDHSLG